MNYIKLQQFNDRLYFNKDNVAELLNIQPDSAKVICSRYKKKGIIIRLKKNYYIMKQKWDTLQLEEYFQIANILQVPSYISFMTALTYYEISTQIQRSFIESACYRRSKSFTIEDDKFNFYIIKKQYYKGFNRIDNIFIAEKEKAFIDCIYLLTYTKYALDINSIDLTKFDFKKIKKILKLYPEKVNDKMREICKF